MLIEFRTDNHIQGREALTAHVQDVVEHALSHVSRHVTRVEVHASDVNGDKGGPADKHCTMEARVEGRPPTVVTRRGRHPGTGRHRRRRQAEARR